MALPDIVQAASPLTFQGRDHVIPGHFVLGLGIPRAFWLGFWDPRLFVYGIRETGNWEYKSRLLSVSEDFRFFLGYVFVLSCVCYVLCASVYMCFVVTCWERADLLALVCGVFCEFVTDTLMSYGVVGIHISNTLFIILQFKGVAY